MCICIRIFLSDQRNHQTLRFSTLVVLRPDIAYPSNQPFLLAGFFGRKPAGITSRGQRNANDGLQIIENATQLSRHKGWVIFLDEVATSLGDLHLGFCRNQTGQAFIVHGPCGV